MHFIWDQTFHKDLQNQKPSGFYGIQRSWSKLTSDKKGSAAAVPDGVCDTNYRERTTDDKEQGAAA